MGNSPQPHMPILIDANNTLHVTGVLPAEIAGVDEAGLASLIARSRYGRDVVCLVCDGAPRARPLGPIHGVQLLYSGSRQSASGHSLHRTSVDDRCFQ